MADSKRTINIEDLGLLNADIIRIQGVRYIDENNYLSTSDDGYVFIEYKGRMDHLYAAKGIKSFITNDTINVIGPAALNRSELEVFECAAAYELSIDAFLVLA